MKIYECLKKDHEKVRKILDQLVVENQDVKVYKNLVTQLRDELIPHARAEEAILYNSIRDMKAGEGVVAHSYQEHMAAETLLRTLQALQIFDTKAIGIAKKLKDAIEHHIAEEEGRVFETARTLLLDQEAEEMGVAFEKMKPEIKADSIASSTWEMVVNLMPQRMREGFRKARSTETSPRV